jgi:hypothetical protein
VYETLADPRYHIRRFLRMREETARAAGIEPGQYLLQVRGLARLRPVTIGALVDRLTERGMVPGPYTIGAEGP